MLEAYAFFAAFTVQILALSVLQPVWLGRLLRAQAKAFPVERFEQLYPGADINLTIERYLSIYRVVNACIAGLGLLMLGWLLGHPTWNEGFVTGLHAVFSMVQFAPIMIYAWIAARNKAKLLKHSLPEGKRKAVLQRRGIFDFVSPFAVFLALLSYLLFIAYVIYVAQNPFPGFTGYLNIVVLTLVYAGLGSVVYRNLYGKKINPIETHAGYWRTIAMGVRVCVYSCIVLVVYFTLLITIARLHLETWMPFAQSSMFLFTALLIYLGFTAPLRVPEADVLDESPVS